jgi:hypothetical protein
MRRLFQMLQEKLEEGGTYYEGKIIGLILSMIACFIFVMGMLLIFG